MTMDSSCSDGGSLRRVAPFRYPRITRYLLLPVAFRSLSRLSSALSAKAFTLCPLSLDLRMLVRILPTFGVASLTRGLISSHCHHQELLLRSKLDSASLHLARIVALYGCPASLASKLAVCLFHPCNSCDSRMKLIFLSSFDVFLSLLLTRNVRRFLARFRFASSRSYRRFMFSSRQPGKQACRLSFRKRIPRDFRISSICSFQGARYI